MMFYVAHKYQDDLENLERAKQITHDLQVNDTENCYVCPLLLFSHLKYNELDYESEMALCLDVLSLCDALIIASDVSEGVQREIDFANLVGMGVYTLYADEFGQLQLIEKRVGTDN